MDSLGVYSLNRMPTINGGSTVSRLNPYFTDVHAVAVFSITAVFHEERQVLQLTFCQSEISSTHEEENQSDAEMTALQFKGQKNATTNPYLL